MGRMTSRLQRLEGARNSGPCLECEMAQLGGRVVGPCTHGSKVSLASQLTQLGPGPGPQAQAAALTNEDAHEQL